MPRSEEVLSIFLASPGDVGDERARLVEVVTHWNRAWSRDLGLRLELIRWEDDAYPDIGEDAQDVINRQVPFDWDIFVGIMWSRFGTPTSRAGSGTYEEFCRAIERHKSSPEGVSLMIYFKDAALPPSRIDTDQLKKVQIFRKEVESLGALSWDFSDTDQFEKLITLHITRHVQDWRRSKTNAGQVASTPSPPLVAVLDGDSNEAVSEPAPPDPPQDDSGYLDLLEEFQNKSSEMAEISLRLTVAQTELTEHTNRGRQELDELNNDPSRASPKLARTIIARVAQQMLVFTSRVEAELPLFRAALDGGLTALTRLATLSAEIYPEQLGATKTGAIELLSTLISARQSTEGFRDSTAALARMTKELNIAKRKQVAALNALVAEFENGETLLTEALTVIDGLSDGNRRE